MLIAQQGKIDAQQGKIGAQQGKTGQFLDLLSCNRTRSPKQGALYYYQGSLASMLGR